MEKYPSGSRERSWKPSGGAIPARVRISISPPYWNDRIDIKNISPFFVFKGYFAYFRHQLLNLGWSSLFFFTCFRRRQFIKSTNILIPLFFTIGSDADDLFYTLRYFAFLKNNLDQNHLRMSIWWAGDNMLA